MRILFVAPQAQGVAGGRKLQTFHEADVRILRSLGHEVIVLPWHRRPWFQLAARAAAADAIFVWTVGDHTAACLILGKALRIPVLVVIGGYEFANLRSLKYGNLANSRGQVLSKMAWKSNATLLFVDGTLRQEGEEAFGPRAAREYILPTGYDANYWKPDGKKEDMVLTVAHAPSRGRFLLKGVDLFLEVASQVPEYQFHIVGQMPTNMIGLGRKNVQFEGWLEREQLLHLYQRAKVYCQLSMHEGLPNSLAESMLCGAVPVGVPVNGIPLLIGPTGFIVPPRILEVSRAVRLAVRADGDYKGRLRIQSLFPLERRANGLRRILKVVGGTP
jgi:glycosyltransferase involved in cell wall biosynthesis